MMCSSRTCQTTLLAVGSALALITAPVGDRAHAEGHLDASYTISFARIPVGEIMATAVFGQNEYAISARARAGGVLKALLVDGQASFSTQGTIEGDHPVPTTFTSKIVSSAETSNVTMTLNEGGNVRELTATPPPSSDRVPVTNSNRQAVVDPLSALLFPATVASEVLSGEACRRTLPDLRWPPPLRLPLILLPVDSAPSLTGNSRGVLAVGLLLCPGREIVLLDFQKIAKARPVKFSHPVQPHRNEFACLALVSRIGVGSVPDAQRARRR